MQERNFRYSSNSINQHNWHLIRPSKSGKRDKSDFEGIERRIPLKLSGRKARTLSVVGEVVIIKSNLAGIAQYSVNWSQIPKYICTEMIVLIDIFFGITLVILKSRLFCTTQTIAWNKIYRPKCEGGLCIRKMEDVNVFFFS